MIQVVKQPNWKHITFKTPKLNFLNWALEQGGVDIIIDDNSYKFKTQSELEALRINLVPSFKGLPYSTFKINDVFKVSGLFY